MSKSDLAQLVKPLRVTIVGGMEIDGANRVGVFLRGEVPALKGAAALFGEDVAILSALDVTKIEALVEAALPYVSPMQNADYGRQLRQHDALVAALAALRGDA